MICERCGYVWFLPSDVIDLVGLCEICTRANILHSQIYHIVGQDVGISQHYKLTIHSTVFEKFKLFIPNKPGKYNKTHIYKKNGKYKILLQQRIFSSCSDDSKLVYHYVDVVLNKKIFWWYMKKIKNE